MADAILQMYASTLGSGTSNSAAFVDLPQSGRLRKVQYLPFINGIPASDFNMWGELSTLPINRMFNNGDYGNVMARFSWCVEYAIAGGSGASATNIPAQEITGLDFRLTIGQRLFFHIYMSQTPSAVDEHVINLYIDA